MRCAESSLIDAYSYGKKRRTGCSRRRVNFVELQVLNRRDDSMGFTSPFFYSHRIYDMVTVFDVIDKMHKDLDKFKEMWIRNNKTNPSQWPMELTESFNESSIFEQFMIFDPALDSKMNQHDINIFIDTVGYERAYQIVKYCPEEINYYDPNIKGYVQMGGFCILVSELLETLNELTKNNRIKVTFSYTDKDWPYSYQEDTQVEFDDYFEIDKWIKENSVRRDVYSVKEVKWI